MGDMLDHDQAFVAAGLCDAVTTLTDDTTGITVKTMWSGGVPMVREIRGLTWDEIVMAMGVPAHLIGDVANASYASAMGRHTV